MDPRVTSALSGPLPIVSRFSGLAIRRLNDRVETPVMR